MCNQTQKVKNSVELADVFLLYSDDYIKKNRVSTQQNKAINAITHCRTAALGGHIARCDHCGTEKVAYNSCRYRHCPKCQTAKQLRWLESRRADLLPVQYFHVVFTIPHELNGIASYNAKVIYNLLFKTAWSVIHTLGKDKKRLDGLTGMLSFLHTWGQNLSQHIHLHCMIPGGALQNVNGQKEWRPCKSGYLFPVKVMSKFFGKTFIKLLQEAYLNNELIFKNSISELAEQKEFEKLITVIRKKSWNVYAKKPFKGAEGGLEYLARYVSKTAIGNERILSCDNDKVKFKWRDYSDQNKSKVMTLDSNEFIRRYLSHVLPNGFMRIRTFGFLANACKTKNINHILSSLNHHKKGGSENKIEKKIESIAELMKRVTGIDINLCQHCKIGTLEIIEIIQSIKQIKTYFDTS